MNPAFLGDFPISLKDSLVQVKRWSVSDRWFYLYAYLFSATYIQDLIEIYYVYGINFKKWWNEQRMWLIRGATCYSFSFVEFTLNQIGISAPDFGLTSKVIDNEQQKRYDREVFDFGVIFTDGILEDMLVQLFLSGFVLTRWRKNAYKNNFDISSLLCYGTGFANK
ncbi:hypothetical protein MKW94_002083 [Papaver nudicaule]|uniref:Uncharacterized protein n=1 Tax=Papaver nudicaule TaxID=74823 RepID=A0AA41RW03_PAPNU|nr:hypothetical protein [Papaver nudicaule]